MAKRRNTEKSPFHSKDFFFFFKTPIAEFCEKLSSREMEASVSHENAFLFESKA